MWGFIWFFRYFAPFLTRKNPSASVLFVGGGGGVSGGILAIFVKFDMMLILYISDFNVL